MPLAVRRVSPHKPAPSATPRPLPSICCQLLRPLLAQGEADRAGIGQVVVLPHRSLAGASSITITENFLGSVQSVPPRYAFGAVQGNWLITRSPWAVGGWPAKTDGLVWCFVLMVAAVLTQELHHVKLKELRCFRHRRQTEAILGVDVGTFFQEEGYHVLAVIDRRTD